jgi:hypothetical protein
VRTNFEGTGGLTSHAKISITHNGREVDISKADCVFWTQSSFEKFVIPYYTRFKTPEEIEAMKENYVKSGVVAMLHFPPSEDRAFPATPVCEDANGNLTIEAPA